MRNKISQKVRLYWNFRDKLAILDGVAMKNRKNIILIKLQKMDSIRRAPCQPYGHKTRLLVRGSVYLINMKSDIKKAIKVCATCLGFLQSQPKYQMISHEAPVKWWEVVGMNTLQFKDEHFLWIPFYFTMFPITKQVDSLPAECFLAYYKSVFAKYGIMRKIMSDVGTHFVPDKFKNVCSKLNIGQLVSSSHHHQSNEQVEACLIF